MGLLKFKIIRETDRNHLLLIRFLLPFNKKKVIMIKSGNLSKDEIEELISNQYIARIGCYDNSKVYIVPVTYSYDSGSSSLVGISGEGMKLDILRSNPRVCVEFKKIDDITNWKTVIAWGNFEEIQGADAKNLVHEFVRKVSALVNKGSFPHARFLKDVSASGSEPKFIVYKIHLKEKSGRFEKSIASNNVQ